MRPKLPVALQARIRNHYSHMWKRTTVWDEPQILEELPRTLRAEVLESINTARLQGITFIYDLGNVGDEATAQLSLRLTPQLAHRHEPVVLVPDLPALAAGPRAAPVPALGSSQKRIHL